MGLHGGIVHDAYRDDAAVAFLPLYVAELGVSEPAAVARWSGVAYGATFFTAALTAPLWGRPGTVTDAN